jgi:hypothetical protein
MLVSLIFLTPQKAEAGIFDPFVAAGKFISEIFTGSKNSQSAQVVQTTTPDPKVLTPSVFAPKYFAIEDSTNTFTKIAQNTTQASTIKQSTTPAIVTQTRTANTSTLITEKQFSFSLFLLETRLMAAIRESGGGRTVPPVFFSSPTGSSANSWGNISGTLSSQSDLQSALDGKFALTDWYGTTTSVTNGGTGLSTAPSYGQVLVGNALGGFTLTATSSLGFSEGQWTTNGSNIYYSTGSVGIGTTSPNTKFTIVDPTAAIASWWANSTTRYGMIGVGSGVITGGGSTDFGIQANQNLLFGTNGVTERMRISTTGNVGIGTTSPTAQLSLSTVAGQSSFAVGSSTGTQFIVDRNGNVGIGTALPTSPLYVAGVNQIAMLGDGGVGTSAYINFNSRGLIGYDTNANSGTGALTIQGAAARGIYFNVNNSTFGSGNAMVITSGGNVGIGTTTPRASLDILKSYSAGTDALRINAGDAASDYWMGIQPFAVGSGNVGYKFRTNNGATTRDTLTLTGGGNVGIGTTSPSNLLHVGAGGTGSTDVNFAIDSASGSGAEPQLRFLKNSLLKGAVYIKDGTEALTFYNNGSDRMVIDTTGNVGIGTTTPYAKLAVDSDTSSNQTLRLTNTGLAGQLLLEDKDQASASTPFYFLQSASGKLSIGSANRNTSTNLTTGSTDIMTFSGGNVGIGTTSPNQILEVHSGTTNRARVRVTGTGTTASNYSGFEIFGLGGVPSAFAGGWFREESTDRLAIWTGSNERMSILQSGNVGIGLTSPTATLHVNAPAGQSAFKVGSSTTYFDINSEGVSKFGYQSSLALETGSKVFQAQRLITPAGGSVTDRIFKIIGEQNNAVSTFSGTEYISAGTFRYNFTGAEDYTNIGSNNVIEVIAQTAGAGDKTMTNFSGLEMYYRNTGSGVTTRFDNIRINDPTSTETVTYLTGLKVAQFTEGTNNKLLQLGSLSDASGNYSIYSPSTYQSYFAGNVGIATTTPAEKLDVYGGINLNGTTKTFSEGDVFSQYDGSSATSYPVIARYWDTSSTAFDGGTFIFGSGANAYVGIEKPGSAELTAFNVRATLSTFVRTSDGSPIRIQDSNGYCEINPTSTTWTCTSDARLKKDIVSVSASSTLDMMNKLRPVSFKWLKQTSTENRYGLIAQEVEAVFPELVTADSNGFKSVSYGSFTPFMISAIQELSLKIEAIQTVPGEDNVFADTSAWATQKIGAVTGIFKNIFAKQVTTETLCVGQTCVTEDQLKALLQNNSAAAASVTTNQSSQTSSNSTNTTNATSTATTTSGTNNTSDQNSNQNTDENQNGEAQDDQPEETDDGEVVEEEQNQNVNQDQGQQDLPVEQPVVQDTNPPATETPPVEPAPIAPSASEPTNP